MISERKKMSLCRYSIIYVLNCIVAGLRPHIDIYFIAQKIVIEILIEIMLEICRRASTVQKVVIEN